MRGKSMGDVAWGTVVMSVLALAGTIYNSYSTRIANRDRMEFDSKTKELEHTVREQGEDIKKCEEDRKALKTAVDRCQEEHKVSAKFISDLQDRVSSLEDKSSH